MLAARQQPFPPAGRWAACVCPHQDLLCSVLSLLVLGYPGTHRHGSTTAGHPTRPSLSPHAGFTHLPTPQALFANPLPTHFMELLEYESSWAGHPRQTTVQDLSLSCCSSCWHTHHPSVPAFLLHFALLALSSEAGRSMLSDQKPLSCLGALLFSDSKMSELMVKKILSLQ